MIHSGIYLLHFMSAYLYMRKNKKPVRSENLTSGQKVFKEGIIWFVRGNTYSKELFTHSINTIRVGQGTPHYFFVLTTNDVTTHHYFFRPRLFSPEHCFCVFKCNILCLLKKNFEFVNVMLFNMA